MVLDLMYALRLGRRLGSRPSSFRVVANIVRFQWMVPGGSPASPGWNSFPGIAVGIGLWLLLGNILASGATSSPVTSIPSISVSDQTGGPVRNPVLTKHRSPRAKTRSPAVSLPHWTYIPEEPGGELVRGVAAGGDFDQDGFSDLAVAEPQFDGNRGRLLIYHGSTNGMASNPGRMLEGNTPGGRFARVIQMLGDVNGDGFDDVFVSIGPKSELNRLVPQRSQIFQGSTNGLQLAINWNYVEWSYPVGDLNGDGFSDVACNCTDTSTPSSAERGQVCVYLGSPSGLKSVPDWVVTGDIDGTHFGQDISGAGDVNGDGFDDLLIGATEFNGRYRAGGKAYLYLGSSTGFGKTSDWSAIYDLPVKKGVDEDHEQFFSWGLGSAGDVNGDGFDDVIVGACFAENGDINEGMAFVFHGSPSGLSSKPVWMVEGNHPHALLGQSLGSAGDVNGDGFSDVIIGVPQAEDGQKDEGAAVVFHGSQHGLGHPQAWTMESDHSHEHFGQRVAPAGDINGDGYADVLVVGPEYERFGISGTTKLGRLVVVFGSPDGLPASHRWSLEKPLLTSIQQSMEHLNRRVGPVVYWGPPLLVLIAVSGGFLFIQARLRRRIALLLAENRALALHHERTRIARDLHDDLGARLTHLSIASATGSHQGQVAREMLQVVQEIVWAVSPENDTLESLVEFVGKKTDETLSAAGVRCLRDFPLDLPKLPLASPLRKNLVLAVREAITNVVKHADATQVWLRVRYVEATLSVDVHDNGNGGRLESSGNGNSWNLPSGGNGLRNIDQRMREIGGTVEYIAAPGQGTCVTFSLKLT